MISDSLYDRLRNALNLIRKDYGKETDQALVEAAQEFMNSKQSWNLDYMLHVLMPDHMPVQRIPSKFPIPSHVFRQSTTMFGTTTSAGAIYIKLQPFGNKTSPIMTIIRQGPGTYASATPATDANLQFWSGVDQSTNFQAIRLISCLIKVEYVGAELNRGGCFAGGMEFVSSYTESSNSYLNPDPNGTYYYWYRFTPKFSLDGSGVYYDPTITFVKYPDSPIHYIDYGGYYQLNPWTTPTATSYTIPEFGAIEDMFFPVTTKSDEGMRCIYMPKDPSDIDYADASSLHLTNSSRRQVIHILGRGLEASKEVVKISVIRYLEGIPVQSQMDLLLPQRPDSTSYDVSTPFNNTEEYTIQPNREKKDLIETMRETLKRNGGFRDIATPYSKGLNL